MCSSRTRRRIQRELRKFGSANPRLALPVRKRPPAEARGGGFHGCYGVVATSGKFKYAYRYGRALMPIGGYFERKAIRGEKTKQRYAIAMQTASLSP